jgi:cytochrome c oxidase subunit IV
MTALSLRTCIAVWIALIVLLAITCGSSFLPLGRFNVVVNFAVAAAKALLVILLFMRLLSGAMMIRIVALIGVFTLAILVCLSLTDFAVRGP